MKAYRGSQEARKSLYKLAMVSLLQGDRDHAKRQFQQLAESPNCTLAPEAVAMLRFVSQEDGE